MTEHKIIFPLMFYLQNTLFLLLIKKKSTDVNLKKKKKKDKGLQIESTNLCYINCL